MIPQLPMPAKIHKLLFFDFTIDFGIYHDVDMQCMPWSLITIIHTVKYFLILTLSF